MREFTRESAEDISAPIAFSPDGKRVVIATTRRQLKLLRLADGRELARFEVPDWTLRILSICFSPDESILHIGTPKSLEFWNLAKVRSRLTELGLDWK